MITELFLILYLGEYEHLGSAENKERRKASIGANVCVHTHACMYIMFMSDKCTGINFSHKRNWFQVIEYKVFQKENDC